ncbi:UNVERIFIED_CONTAM: hypothetical protein Slati_2213000 [Sesamum latifolium]|uniref:Uncharacterized protein n=1 Tax=Sesamum latifolium TaxID=2727402 RepID=A0AAW2WU44_9LAMI
MVSDSVISSGGGSSRGGTLAIGAMMVQTAHRGTRMGGGNGVGLAATGFNPLGGVEDSPSPNFATHCCFKECSAAHDSASPSSTTRLARARNSVKLKSCGFGPSTEVSLHERRLQGSKLGRRPPR